MMKMKIGTAGEDPQKDSFPFFKGNKKWTCLMWVGSPTDWKLINFEKERPEDIYETDDSKASYVMISSVTEIFLELAPSTSFRIYQGTQVIRCTPQPESREHAEAWVNAVFAAMQIQNMGESNDGHFSDEILQLRDRYVEEVGQQQAEDEEEDEYEEGGVVG